MTSTKPFITYSQGALLCAALTFSVFFVADFAHAETLNRQLQLGMSGADVTALQTYLASDSTLYPQGLITGYYGILTQAAVSNFQSRNGIANVGRVGPATLPVLNLAIAGGTGDQSAPIISGVTINTGPTSANLSWSTNESAKGVVYYSPSPLVTYERTNSVDVSGTAVMTDTNFRNAQSVSISNLNRNTTYYYLVYTTDQSGLVSVTWPSSFRTAN